MFTCPECGGSLWELANGDLARYICHVGHSYTPDALASGMAATLESALWTALRSLEESAAFYRRMQERADQQHMPTIAGGYRAKADEADARAEIVRRALLDDVAPPAATDLVPPSAEDGAE